MSEQPTPKEIHLAYEIDEMINEATELRAIGSNLESTEPAGLKPEIREYFRSIVNANLSPGIEKL
jgi:hypothetical protein